MIQHAAKTAGYYIGQYPPVDSIAYHLKTILKELKIDLILDVGAHEGEFAGSLRELGYAGDIISFEPVGSSFAKLTKARAADKRWSGHNIALGREDGHLELNIYEGSVFNSFLNPQGPSRFEQQRVVGTEKVSVRRLESVLDEILADRPARRIFLKMDTQGYDLVVLRSAGRRLPAIRALQTELAARRTYAGMPSLLEALTELDLLGFDLTGIFPVTREMDHLRIIELDCVMCRKVR
jgi:FkbM family methyltransferase